MPFALWGYTAWGLPGQCINDAGTYSATRIDILFALIRAHVSCADRAGQRDQDAAAVAFKDRLVDYDRNARQRTTVVDDQNDFFEIDTNAWLDPEVYFCTVYTATVKKFQGRTAGLPGSCLPWRILPLKKRIV